MKETLSAAFSAYRQYRAAKAKSRTYKVLRYVVASAVLAYVLLLSFPQVLFAHEVSHKNFKVYSREPLNQNIHSILDNVEARLLLSGINNQEVKPKIFIFDSHGLYAFFSLYVGAKSFAKGYPAIPNENIFVNRSDIANDLVFRNAQADNERSLNGVIAHEATHLLIRKKLGYLKNLALPSWKKEGYSEYIAGGTLLDYETGVRRWKENPNNDSSYRYFKYYMLVKYLIETEKLSVEEVFSRSYDVQELGARVLSTL